MITTNQEHVLVVIELEYVACIRSDANYVRCFNRVRVNGIINAASLSLI